MKIIRITVRNDDCSKVVVSDKSKNSLLELWSKAKGAVTLYGKKARENMKKVFICSPYRGDVKKNTGKTRTYCRRAYEEGCIPIAPHLLFPQFLDEADETERAAGIAMGLELMQDCNEVWVFGNATVGMEQEIRFAVGHGKHVWFKEIEEGESDHEACNDCNKTDRK